MLADICWYIRLSGLFKSVSKGASIVTKPNLTTIPRKKEYEKSSILRYEVKIFKSNVWSKTSILDKVLYDVFVKITSYLFNI